MKKSNILFLLIAILSIGLLSGCADVTTIEECTKATHQYGFWGGLWHGMISFFSFIGSLIYDDVALYAVNNNGPWYDFGFVLGAGIIFGGGSKATNRRK